MRLSIASNVRDQYLASIKNTGAMPFRSYIESSDRYSVSEKEPQEEHHFVWKVVQIVVL
ncbi:hypothetical protein SAMN06269173_10136 [Hymenobacter mucosus]|uniref:Uncharacterized protein n=1 Tax=Hymenobacter mucosus TaxID=1411120 RepID=A0A238V591_9BACT|nr:hypothetical protein SAMN06269173_10136 [Hymenobacter mucosus]